MPKPEYDLALLELLRPIDDEFMRMLFRDNLPLAQEVLRIITAIEDLVLVSEETQRDLKRLVGARSIELDVWGTDSTGRWYDIEVQRGEDPNPRRARYYSASMDIEALDKGAEFEDLPEQWVVFVMEHDPFGKGKGTYVFERGELSGCEALCDGSHIVYANGAYRGDDPLGDLMHDFCESDPDQMRNKLMAERVRYFKRSKKGAREMSKTFQDYLDEMRKESEARGEVRGEARGKEKSLLDVARRLMKKLSLSEAGVLDLLDVPEPERPRYLAELQDETLA